MTPSFRANHIGSLLRPPELVAARERHRVGEIPAEALRETEAMFSVPVEQLCLSPQCGFASTHHGNALSIAEQWRKLELVVEVARRVWG